MPILSSSTANFDTLSSANKRLKYHDNSDDAPELTASIRDIDVDGYLINPSNHIDHAGDFDGTNLEALGYEFYDHDPTLLGRRFLTRFSESDLRKNHKEIYLETNAFRHTYIRKLFRPKFRKQMSGIVVGCYTFQVGKTMFFGPLNDINMNFPDGWRQVQRASNPPFILISDVSYTALPIGSFSSGKRIAGIFTSNNGTSLFWNIPYLIFDNILAGLQINYPNTNPAWSIDVLFNDIQSSTTQIWAEIIVNSVSYNNMLQRQIEGQLTYGGSMGKNIKIVLVRDDPTILLPDNVPSETSNIVLAPNEFAFSRLSFAVTTFTKSGVP